MKGGYDLLPDDGKDHSPLSSCCGPLREDDPLYVPRWFNYGNYFGMILASPINTYNDGDETEIAGLMVGYPSDEEKRAAFIMGVTSRGWKRL